MRIGVPRERAPDECRVGLTPHQVRLLVEHDHRVYVEAGAGHGAGYADESYREAGRHIVYDEVEVCSRSELLAKIGPLETEEIALLSANQIVFAFQSLHTLPAVAREGIPPSTFVILGCGVAGTQAVRAAAGDAGQGARDATDMRSAILRREQLAEWVNELRMQWAPR